MIGSVVGGCVFWAFWGGLDASSGGWVLSGAVEVSSGEGCHGLTLSQEEVSKFGDGRVYGFQVGLVIDKKMVNRPTRTENNTVRVVLGWYRRIRLVATFKCVAEDGSEMVISWHIEVQGLGLWRDSS